MTETQKLIRSLGGLSVLSVTSAVMTYLFLAIVARNINADEFGLFTVAWSLTYTISGAVLSSAEPEITRLILGQKWRSSRNVLLRASGLIMLAILVFAVVTHSDVAETHVSYTMLGLITLLLLLMLLEILARSVFASAKKRLAFGLISPIDAGFRLSAIGILVVTSQHLTIEMTFVSMLLGSGIVGVLSCAVALPTISQIFKKLDDNGKHLPRHKFGYGYLLIGTISMTALISGVPMIVGMTSSLESSELGVLGAALIIARVPLVLIMGFESVLVQEFDMRIQRTGSIQRFAVLLLGLSTCFGLSGFGAGFLLGPQLVEIVAGHIFAVGGYEMALFGSAIGFLLGGILLTPLNIASGRHARIAISWSLSLVLFVLTVLVFGESLVMVGWCLTGASYVCVCTLSISSRNKT